MKNYVWSGYLVVLAASALSLNRAAASSLSNSATYCDAITGACQLDSPPPYTSVSVDNSTPIVIPGQNGGASSTLSYNAYTGQILSTGYLTSVSFSGSGGSIQQITNDLLTISGGVGSGSGVAIVNLTGWRSLRCQSSWCGYSGRVRVSR